MPDPDVARRARRLARFCASRAGFTLLEVLHASVLLTAGIGALLGTALWTGRLVVGARQASRRTQAAGARFEALRAEAATAPRYCAGLFAGRDSTPDGATTEWQLRPGVGAAQLSVIVAAPVPGGQRADTLRSSVACP